MVYGVPVSYNSFKKNENGDFAAKMEQNPVTDF